MTIATALAAIASTTVRMTTTRGMATAYRMTAATPAVTAATSWTSGGERHLVAAESG
jgi:hypothetical protein